MPITRCISCSSPWFDGSSGPHDNYGSALTAQPGRSQGRPATNTSSRLIVQIGLPTDVLPVPLVPDGHTICQDQSCLSRMSGHRDPHTGYKPDREHVRNRASPHRALEGMSVEKDRAAMIFKFAEAAERNWRRIDGHNQLPKIILGVTFANGIEVVRLQVQPAAA
jgi:hypothetical protein